MNARYYLNLRTADDTRRAISSFERAIAEDPAFAPAGPSQGGPSDDCMKGFMPLRTEAEKRGKLMKKDKKRLPRKEKKRLKKLQAAP